MSKLVFNFETLQLSEEKVLQLAIDYYENYIVLLTQDKLYLFSLKLWECLSTLELKGIGQEMLENWELKFGKLGKVLYLCGQGSMLMFQVLESEHTSILKLLDRYILPDVSTFEPDQFRKRWCVVAHPQQICYTKFQDTKCLSRLINITWEETGMEEEISGILQILKVSKKIPKDLIQYSDDSEDVRSSSKVISHLILIKYSDQLHTKQLIVIYGEYLMVILVDLSNNTGTIISKHQLVDLKVSGLTYSEQTRQIVLYDYNSISMFKLDEKGSIECLQYKIPQPVNWIQCGQFFQVPFHMEHKYINRCQFVYFSSNISTLGTQVRIFSVDGNAEIEQPIQNTEKKSKQMIPILKFNSSFIVLYDNGTVNLLKCVQQSQWEHLDFQFSYLVNNQECIEQEMDLEHQDHEGEIDISIFQQRLYDPIYLYQRVLNKKVSQFF